MGTAFAETKITLEGRVVIVTGASSGIGAATAVAVARAGGIPAIAGRDAARLAATAAAVRAEGFSVSEHVIDLTEPDAPQRLVREVLERHGQVDNLIHVAATIEVGPFHETEIGVLDRQYDANVRAPFLLAQAVLPELSRGDSIVFVGSTASQVGFATTVAYSATKGAVTTMARTLAVEVAPTGIRVNVVAPGMIRTPMTIPQFAASPPYEQFIIDNTPLGRVGEPEDIAPAAVFLASDAAAFVHGAVLNVDGGWTAR